MKVLAQLLEGEKKEIETIFERMNSINSLVGTLADAQLDIDEQNWIYEKLINDTTKTRLKFKEWWTSSCDKYGLDKDYTNKYFVDFTTNCIVLNED